MTIEFQAKPDHNLAILVHTGRIPDNQFIAFYKSLYENENYDQSMNHLVDLREADSTPRSTEALCELAEFASVKSKGITTCPKIAVVAPENISFGLSRMYQAFTGLLFWDFVVFRAMDVALAWLGLPADLMDLPNQDTQLNTRE